MKHQLECSRYITVVSTHTHLEPTKHFDLVKKNKKAGADSDTDELDKPNALNPLQT